MCARPASTSWGFTPGSGRIRAGLLAPALDQPFDRHLFVGQEMTVPDLGGAEAAGQFSQAQGLARDDRIEKLSPLLSRRRSRKRPNEEVGLGLVCGDGVVSCVVSINMAAPHPIRKRSTGITSNQRYARRKRRSEDDF